MRKLILSLLIVCSAVFATDLLAKPKILLLYADDITYANDVKAKLTATNEFDVIDMFDNKTGTVPSLALLQSYDGVLVWSNYGPTYGSGDVIVQYIDGGGKVVVCEFSIYGANFSDGFASPKYRVITANTYGTGQASLGTVALPNHPIMKNVSSFNGGGSAYRAMNTQLTANSYTIASWTDGNILIAANEKIGNKQVRRADVNFFPPSSAISSSWWQQNTDGGRIIANALLWVINTGTPTQFSLSPEKMNFGSQYPGTPTVLCGTIRNVGPGTLQITSMSLAGSTDFAIQSGPNVNDTISAGGSVPFCIRFNPSIVGTRNASFTVVTNGVDSGTQVVDLTGIGAAPSMTVSEAAIFRKNNIRLRDSFTVCVPLTSSGVGAVRIDSVVIRGTDSTAYSVASRPTLIQQGTTEDVCIRFKPNFQGRTDAQAWIYSNAFNKPLAKIPMFGNGILGRFVMSPSTLNFDSVMMGETACKVVMIKNPGTDTLRILRNYVASTDADYVFTPLSGRDTVIRPEDSVAFNVCFTPKRNGTRLARYIFNTSIPKTFELVSRDTSRFVLDIEGVGVPVGKLAMNTPAFPATVVGDEICRTDTLINGGATPVTVTSASIAGMNSSEFTMSGLSIPTTLAPGEKRLITICFKAADRGEREAMILFGTSNDGKTGEATFDLDGTGLLNCAQADPMSIFDGSMTYVGTKETKTITVTNCGEVDRSYAVSILAGSNGYRIVGPTSSGTVAPNGTTTFDIEFNPTAMGLDDGTVVITGGPTPLSILLNGTGGAVMLGATGNATSVMQGDCKTFDVTVTNNGNVDWTPGTGVISGPNGADFTIESAPSLIAAGESGVVTIKFCASTSSSETASLNFPSATPTAITTAFPYALSGLGTPSGVTVSEMKGYSLGQSYPNPMSSMSTFTFTQPHAGKVKIELIDQTGRSIPVAEGVFPMGENTVQINAANLTSGNYLYVLSNEEVRLTRQLTIVK